LRSPRTATLRFTSRQSIKPFYAMLRAIKKTSFCLALII